MKGFAFVLLCALVAVQGRSTAVQKTTREVAKLGENPWVVHLRIAVSTSGLLNSCSGSLIDNRWVLTAAECLADVRYIWVRYGVVNVVNPTLVTENSLNILNKSLGLINLNRYINSEANISPVGLSTGAWSENGNLCFFGATSDGTPGEILSCSSVGLKAQEDGSIIIKSDEVAATQFDLGASVVSDGVQVGVVTSAASEDNAGVVTPVAEYLAWIEENTGLNLISNPEPEPEPEVAPEVVKVVN